METFSFSPPINLVEEDKRLLSVTSFGATRSNFKITNGNFSFSITIPGHWQTKSDEKTLDELNNIKELRSQKSIELHVEQVRKKGLILKNDYSLSSLDTLKNGILEEIKNPKYNDLDDLDRDFN